MNSSKELLLSGWKKDGMLGLGGALGIVTMFVIWLYVGIGDLLFERDFRKFGRIVLESL